MPQPRCGQTVENALIGPSSMVRTSQSDPSVTLSSRSQASSRAPVAVTRSGLPGLDVAFVSATRDGSSPPLVVAAPERARQKPESGDEGYRAGDGTEARGQQREKGATRRRGLGCHREGR